MPRQRLVRPRTLVAPLALAGALAVAAAHGAAVTDPHALVQSAVGGEGHVWVSIDAEGTATLGGYVDSASTRHRAELAALRGDGVSDVVNLISDD